MIYVNNKSVTCDFEGPIKELMLECTILLSNFHGMVIKECDKEFTDKMLVEIGRLAVTTDEEAETMVKEILGKVLS